ncbi:MAG: 5'/3'-nucleotidase SurE [Chloroflexi bacterium RBG_16_68_14]|nr:MAG: 5'/3'-nucleotidase SurE [Chloroflexi bacterium RBG_16_68_14]
MERHILVTNDDGIESPGLWKLAEAMAEFGKVMVVAPASEASGSGTMVTYRRDIQVQQVPERIPGVKAYMVDGPPADCVLIGLRRLKEGWISLVASGINPGPNLGVDFFLSGTCGAALIAAFRRVTSIAISQDLVRTEEGVADPRWDTSQAVARLLGRSIEEGLLPEGSLLNVNVPARPLAELRGIAITRVAPGGYMHLSERGDGVHERLEREIVADARHAHPGTDIRAVLDGYVSISPLDTTLSNEEHIRRLADSVPSLSAQLADGSCGG